MLPIQRNNYQTDLNVSPEMLNDRRQNDDRSGKQLTLNPGYTQPSTTPIQSVSREPRCQRTGGG